MTLYGLVKQFIPPIYYTTRRRVNRFCHPIVSSPLPQITRNSKKIVVIGNGPSLNDSIDKYKREILINDRICVNFFGSSNLYEELKPNIYVFADPAFFWIPDDLQESVKNLFNNIILKTSWPLQIIIPSGAKGAPMEEKLLSNKNIKIDYYFNGYQNVGKMSKFEAWDRNLIAPPAQNVLNVCIYLSLFWEYPETYIIGADSSFLEDIRIDQETNELFSIDSHFYKQNKVYSDKKLFDSKKGRACSDWKLHELIYAYARMFEYYADLKEYANYKGLKVYNASEYSWINSFERKKLR